MLVHNSICDILYFGDGGEGESFKGPYINNMVANCEIRLWNVMQGHTLLRMLNKCLNANMPYVRLYCFPTYEWMSSAYPEH